MISLFATPEVLHLSAIELNLRSREVRRDLSDPWEMRRTLLHAFESGSSPELGEGSKHAGRLLFRVDHTTDRSSPPQLLVQHCGEADWSRLPDHYLHDYPARQPRQRADLLNRLDLISGTRLRFRLRANPVKSQPAPRGADGRAPRGKRIAILSADAQVEWLKNQFKMKDQGGGAASLQGVSIVPEGWRNFRKAKDAKSVCHIVLFEGILTVDNPEAFQGTVAAGVGPGKGFGCGLLSLAPA